MLFLEVIMVVQNLTECLSHDLCVLYTVMRQVPNSCTVYETFEEKEYMVLLKLYDFLLRVAYHL